MVEQRHVRSNWRGRPVPFPAGWIAVAAALVALAPLALLQRLADADLALPVAVTAYALGVAVLGLVDDVLGTPAPAGPAVRPAPRGWRGHLDAVRAGRF